MLRVRSRQARVWRGVFGGLVVASVAVVLAAAAGGAGARARSDPNTNYVATVNTGSIVPGTTDTGTQPPPPLFSTGNPDGQMGMGSRQTNATGGQEIEAADDFVLSSTTSITDGTFTGILAGGATTANVQKVAVEIYRVFPLDSANPPSGHVPTRTNSPSDVEFDSRSTGAGTMTETPTVLNGGASFVVSNSVLNGINPIPNQTTGGEGPESGQEVLFTVTFSPAFSLPADHYFFVPQVQLSSGEFFWLSAPKPIVAPGTPFTPDLQAWIRNASLSPDWLRVGTDIVGGGPAPTFNGTFSLNGSAPTAVTVALLRATRTRAGVTLRWRTASQAGLLGFDVLRARGGAKVRVNRTLIPSAGGLAGSTYAFVDRSAPRRAGLRYWVEAVSSNGAKQLFGPVGA